MNGVERRRPSFKQRLGFDGMGCCGGAAWGFGPTTISVRDEEELEVEVVINVRQGQGQGQDRPENISDPGCLTQTPVSSGMNLAAALALERQIRAVIEPDETPVATNEGRNRTEETSLGTPARVSLMKLMEEAIDGGDEKNGGGVGSDTACCVCMGRNRGAAFIPCGHTFCRVCSRELWLNRGSCPLCNRLILEILDIF